HCAALPYFAVRCLAMLRCTLPGYALQRCALLFGEQCHPEADSENPQLATTDSFTALPCLALIRFAFPCTAMRCDALR
ncbi:MAG: hypothetical protein ACR2PH_01425, partial [Desulfobulbia bacterium]